MEKLKECPFCGSEADLMICMCTGSPTRYYAHCTSCRASVGKVNDEDGDETGAYTLKERAIEVWNRRVAL